MGRRPGLGGTQILELDPQDWLHLVPSASSLSFDYPDGPTHSTIVGLLELFQGRDHLGIGDRTEPFGGPTAHRPGGVVQ